MPKKDVERKLPPDIDFDLYGHCVLCHDNMLKEEIVDGKMVIRLMGKATTAEYLLNTGARMNVSMCVYCKDKLDDSDEELDEIMKSVVAGWEIEASDLVASISKPHWNDRVKKEHMALQEKKEIVFRSEGKGPDVALQKLGKFKSRKKKKKDK